MLHSAGKHSCLSLADCRATWRRHRTDTRPTGRGGGQRSSIHNRRSNCPTATVTVIHEYRRAGYVSDPSNSVMY